MTRKWYLIGGVIALLIAAPLAWYLISPLFINNAIDEGFPVAAAPSAVPGTTISGAGASGVSTATPPPATATPPPSLAPTATVTLAASAAPAQGVAPIAAVPTATTAPSPTPQPTVAPVAPTPPQPSAAPAGPVVVRTGQFHAVDHEGSGTATIYRLPDGKLVLRLENFSVLNGPDLYVYLSAAPDANNSATISNNAFVSLGRLKGNQGNQNYDLPADLDLAQTGSVVIWCQRFRSNFSTAPLK